VATALDGAPALSGLEPAAWVTACRTLDEIRQAIGAAAKGKKLNGLSKDEKKAWFKQEASGEQLGSLLIQYWTEIEATPLGRNINELYAFTYGEKLP
jgi:hypothetical protein